jgi:hypothetical protein
MVKKENLQHSEHRRTPGRKKGEIFVTNAPKNAFGPEGQTAGQIVHHINNDPNSRYRDARVSGRAVGKDGKPLTPDIVSIVAKPKKTR